MPARPAPTAALPASSVTTKGQATIPAEYRRLVGLGPGDRVTFELDGDRIILRKAAPPPLPVDQAWNAAQSRFMGEWDSEEDAVFDDER